MSLEADLPAAADTLLEGNHLYRAGQIHGTARLAADAVELGLKTLIPLPPHLRSAPGRKVRPAEQYRYRRKEGARRFGLSEADLEELHDLRLVDRFREDRHGNYRVLTEDEARWALRTADGVLRALLSAGELSQETLTLVLERLAMQGDPSPEEELMEMVEHEVGWGHYRPAVRARLLRLDRLFASRRSTVGLHHHARIVTLRAHTAMNLGEAGGPDGAITLAGRIQPFWEQQQNRARTIHVLNVQSIVYRELNRPDLSEQLVEKAVAIAGGDQEFLDNVNSERSSVLLALGDAGGSAALLRDALARRRAAGDLLGEANDLRKIGKAEMRSGNLIEAEIALLRAQELTPPDDLMAQCVLANSLAELYAHWGDKREAHRWAEAARQLVSHRGYAHQGRVLDEIIKRFPEIW